jgi:hypothetical protein
MESSKEKLSTWTIGDWFVSSEVASRKSSVTSFHCPEEATAFDIALSIVAGTLSTLRWLQQYRTSAPKCLWPLKVDPVPKYVSFRPRCGRV